MGFTTSYQAMAKSSMREVGSSTPRTEWNAQFGATGPVQSPYRANATVHGTTDSNPLLNIERQKPLFCSTPVNLSLSLAVRLDFFRRLLPRS